MTSRFGSIDSMAFVRSIRPWDHASQDEYAPHMERIETTLRLEYSSTPIDSVTIPIGSDETLGRMAFYLARRLQDSGLNTSSPTEEDAPDLHDVIMDNRLRFENNRGAVPEMLRLAEDYNLLSASRGRTLGRSALVIVTDEPFMLSVAYRQETMLRIPIADQTNEIPNGGVLPVDLNIY